MRHPPQVSLSCGTLGQTAQIPDPKTNLTQCGTEPTNENWGICLEEITAQLKGNVSMVKDSPSIGGYYACDDCCHMNVLNQYGDAEYRALSAVRDVVRSVDPYHLMFGTIACGETWYWSEEGAGLAMDVMMKEGYGGAVGTGYPYPSQYRVFPMTFEPLVLMPDPLSLGAPHVYRAHSYEGAATAGMYHTNAFVENNAGFHDWQMNTAVAAYSAEMSDLLPSFGSKSRYAAKALMEVIVASATGTPLGGNASTQYTLVGKILTEDIPERGVSDSYYCHTLILVNPRATPCAATVSIVHLLSGSGLSPSSTTVESMPIQRIYNGHYETRFRSTAATDTAILNDFVDARGANVYRIGCLAASDPSNLIVEGSIEGLPDLQAPGRLQLGGISYVAGNHTDDRTRITASTAAPYEGRYSAEVNIATGAAPVTLNLPLSPSAFPPVEAPKTYHLEIWLRSSPPGVAATLGIPEGLQISSGPGSVQIGVGWTALNATLVWCAAGGISAQPPYSLTLALHSPLPAGGTVWLDGATLKAAAAREG